MLTVQKKYSINFTELQNKFYLSLSYNEVNIYIFVNGVEICKFKAKDFEINAFQLCLCYISKDFSVNNMKMTELYGHVYDLSLILIVLMLMIFRILLMEKNNTI